MSDLPAWVYDVVIELQRWSDTHPRLHAQFAGSDEWQPVDQCGCEALALVPKDVLDNAKVIRDYVRDHNPDPTRGTSAEWVVSGPVTIYQPDAPDPRCTCGRADVSTPDHPTLTMTSHPLDPDCPVHQWGKR